MTPEEKRKVAQVTDKLVGEHKKWIQAFVASNLRGNLTYDDLMSALDTAVETGGNSIYTGDRDIEFPNELWVHYQALRGGQVAETVRDNTYFRCAC